MLDLGLAAEPLRLLQTELGLVISLTQIEMPLLLLPLLAVMSRIDPNLMDASASLGASPWRTLFRVILPLAAPGLAAGCLLVFASSTTAFISQSVIGGGRLVYLPAMIWQQAMVVANWPFAATAAVMLLVSVSAVHRGDRLCRARGRGGTHPWLGGTARGARLRAGHRRPGHDRAADPGRRRCWWCWRPPFTDSRSIRFPPQGFSFRWYELLLDEVRSRQIHRAAGNTLAGRGALAPGWRR